VTPGQTDVLGITGCTAGVAVILAAICAADRHVDTWTRRRAAHREERAVVRTAETITRTAAQETQT
jgi:hypothetical protein